MTMVIDGTNGVQFPDSSIQTGAIGRNRIINGDMRIDQRNAGASKTVVDATYYLDRFKFYSSQASKLTVQQNLNTITPPVGFTNYMGITVANTATVGSTDYFEFIHYVEGYNIADLAWGTANAKTVTLSFWVRCSVTGTFGGAIRNGPNRNYPFTYTISSANTWEFKTVTIPGDTSGTWLTNNGVGLSVNISLGMGSTYSAAAGSWVAGSYDSATGATSIMGTSGATFYITGMQLEKGSAASPFEYRSFGQELALCQRYFQKSFDYSIAPANGGSSGFSTAYGLIAAYSTNSYTSGHTRWLVTMRDIPTMTYYGNSSGYWAYNGTFHVNVSAGNLANDNGMFFSQQAVGGGAFIYGHYTASAEL